MCACVCVCVCVGRSVCRKTSKQRTSWWMLFTCHVVAESHCGQCNHNKINRVRKAPVFQPTEHERWCDHKCQVPDHTDQDDFEALSISWRSFDKLKTKGRNVREVCVELQSRCPASIFIRLRVLLPMSEKTWTSWLGHSLSFVSRFRVGPPVALESPRFSRMNAENVSEPSLPFCVSASRKFWYSERN